MIILQSPYPAGDSGYDIFLAAGDSNNYYGSPFDAGIDIGDAKMYEYPPQGPSPNTIHLAQDPLGWYELLWSTDPTGRIGFSAAFARDYYLPNTAGKRVLIVPYARGGSRFNAAWLAPSGSLLTAATTLTNDARTAAIAALPGSTIKGVLLMLGVNDLINAVSRESLRSNLHKLIDAFRTQLTGGTDIPVVLGGFTNYGYEFNPGTWANAQSGADFRAAISTIANKMAFTAYADSESPTVLGTTDVHFTASEQRTMAARYWTAWQAALLNTDPILKWDANDKGANLTTATGAYADSDVSAGATAVWNSIRATRGRNTGKYYFEAQVVGTTANRMIGLSNSGLFTNTYSASGSNSGSSAAYWANQANAVTGWTKDWTGTPTGAWVNNDVVMIAVDFSIGKAWAGRNGTWGNSGNPAAGTGSWISNIPAGQTIWPSVSMYQSSGVVKLRRAAEYSHAIPSGFSAWG